MASWRLNRINIMKPTEFINRAVTVLFLSVVLANNVYAEDAPFLTLDKLVEDGYVQLTGLQLIDLLKQHKVEVRDIATDAVSHSTRIETDADSVESRKSETVKSAKSAYFLDTRLLARAPPLEGVPELTVSEDTMVATDGVRTYRYRFFEKQGKMYGVRDIDHGNVFYEIVVK